MDIDRKKFKRMMVLISRIDEVYYRALKSIGIKDNLFVLLYAIYDGETYSQKRICDEWLIPKTTLNTIVNECVREGYVELVPSGCRVKKIVLTEAGRTFAESVLEPIFKAESRTAQWLEESDVLEKMEEFTYMLENDFGTME